MSQKHPDIEHELLTYYRHLLSEPPTNHTQDIESIINHIPKEVTKEKTEALMHPITQEEVDQALKDTLVGKSLGLDEFTTQFFYHCWDMIREEIREIIEDSRNSGQFL